MSEAETATEERWRWRDFSFQEEDNRIEDSIDSNQTFGAALYNIQ